LCTLATALPDGSSIPLNSLLHLAAVGVEHAIEEPTGTVNAADLPGKKLSNSVL